MISIFVDESGSINNHNKHEQHFVISLVYAKDPKALKKSYKRFVSANIKELKKLDKPRDKHLNGKMFKNGKFVELKGAEFDVAMKKKFIKFFQKQRNFEVFYIDITNKDLEDIFCENTARVFNFTMKIAIECFIKKGFLPNEDYILQLDERNEKTRSKYFLENYLNTELRLSNAVKGKFTVNYFDSADNKLIQIADVFANIYYSGLFTKNYTNELRELKRKGFIRYIFKFPIPKRAKK